MMLNAMAPQRHHQQPAGSPLLLTTTSSSTTSSSLSSSSSSSNSSTSLPRNHNSSNSSSNKQNTNIKNDHDATQISRSNSQSNNSPTPATTSSSTTTTLSSTPVTATKITAAPTTTSRSPCLPQAQKQATTNDTTSNPTANTLKTTTTSITTSPVPIPIPTSTPNATTKTTTTNSSNNIQHQHHYQNNSYQSHRSLNNHYNNNNSSYASRPSNQHRTHNSGNHNHNHHSHHNNQHQQSSQDHLPIESSCSNSVQVNLSSTTTMPVGDSVVLSPATASTPANQRHHQHNGPPHYVDLHVNAGECVSLQMLDGQEQVVAGPTTITMISQQQSPPVPIPVQAPPGHMIHQIADENGTLKHIILSVMDSDETNAQLDSTVITLPQGTFRINSHGELISIGSDGSNGDSTLPLTTLPQQAYFANYDGCPVAYNATPSTQIEADIIDSRTIATAILPSMVDSTETTNNNIINDKNITQHSEQQEHVKNKFSVTGSGDKKKSMKGRELSSKENIVTENHDIQLSNVTNSNLSQTTPVVESLIVSSEQEPKEELSTSIAVSSSAANEAEQMVVPTSISDTSYTTSHHQVMPTNEVDIMNGAMAPPILSTVDGQLYSYPPCCCCCYCDPQETSSTAASGRGAAAAAAGPGHNQQQHQEQPQQPPLTMNTLPGQHQQNMIVGPTESHSSDHNTPHGNDSSRMSSRGSANSLANGVMAYGPPLIGPPMQSNFALPISVVGPHGTQIIPPIATSSQNGIQTMQGPGMGLLSEHQQQPSGKVHPGKGGRGSSGSGYKQHKINSSNSQNQSDSRQQNYNTNHYSSASYNNIVSGHHHQQQQQSQQNPYHNHNHHHNHNHNQITSDQSSSFVKSQALLPNQMISGGNYSPVYSNYNHVPASLTTIVSSNKVGQQNPYVRASPESDNYIQSQQRGSREPVSYSSHLGNNYTSPNVRSGGQHQQHNESKRQNLGDKSSLTNQHNSNTGRYNSSANVKILASNHLLNSNSQSTSGNSSHNQAGAVSPMRGRMKGSSSTQYHHQPNGIRTSNYYNQIQHDSKDNSLINVHPTPNNPFQQHARDSGISANHHMNHVKSKTVYSHGQDQHSTASAKSKQHINTNSSPYYQPNQAQVAPQNKGAWQSSQQQHKPALANNGLGSTHDSEGSNFEHHGGQKPNQSSEPHVNKQPKDKASNEDFDTIDAGGLPSFAISSANANSVNLKNQDDVDSRSSRGKQKKCQNNQTIKNSSTELHSGDRLKQVPVSNEASNKSDPISNEISRLNEQDEKSGQSEKISKSTAAIPDSLSWQAKDSSSTKQQPQPQSQSKNGNQKRTRDKSSSQQSATSKSKDTSQQGTVESGISSRHPQDSKSSTNKLNPSQSESTIVSESDLKQSSELPSIDSKRRNSNGDSSSSIKDAPSTNRQLSDEQLKSLELNSDERIELQQRKHKNKHNTNQQATTTHKQTKNESSSPARIGTTTKKNSKTSQSSLVLKTDDSQVDPESLADEELDNDIVSTVSRPDSPAVTSGESKDCQNQAPSLNISMRTSYSENNIQSLDTLNSSVKSTKTTPQKFPLATNELLTTTKSGSSSSDSIGKKNHSGGDKKRVSSARTDHKTKLSSSTSSMPQLRLLNLNCTSVTSSSVQLRWSYIPNLAEKYGIHPHSGGGSKNLALMDHFVIESSSAKSVETGTLISPKVVYQGCSFTCRVNHLSSEKIYHFKVRRTALVTAINKGESQSIEIGSSEHLVVSEILSVTLPSVQQYQQQLNASQQHQQCLSNKKSSSSGSKSSSNSLIDYHQATASSSTGFHHESGSMTINASSSGTPSAYHRGNSSSHHSNSNNGKALLPSIKFSSLFRQCRTKFVTMLGRLVQNSLSSYSDTKFAGLLLILFTIFAMLLAIFIHLYIVAPVSE